MALHFRTFAAAALLAVLSLCLLPLTSGQSTVPAPVITSLSGCPISAQDGVTLLCVLPFTLTVAGSGFNGADVVNISDVACLFVSISVDLSQLTCQFLNSLPAVRLGLGVDLPVAVLDAANHLQSNVLSNIQLVPVQPVILSAISGCTGSGSATNGCDLSSAVVTLSGSGFVQDTQLWYLVLGDSSGSLLITASLGASGPSNNWLTINSDGIVFSLRYIQLTYGIVASTINSTTGTMGLCLTRGNTASNCLALSYTYSAPNVSLPVVQPISGFSVNSSLLISSVTGCPTSHSNGSSSGCSFIAITSLTITGSSDWSAYQRLYVTVGNRRCTGPNLAAGSPNVLTCSIPSEYAAVTYGTWLPVIVRDLIAQQESPAAYLVQFAPPISPTLTSVTGCLGDSLTSSLSTIGCNKTSVLTLLGADFVSGGRTWLLSSAVVGSTSLTTFVATHVDDNTITIPVSALLSIFRLTGLSTVLTLYLFLNNVNQFMGPVIVTIPTPPLAVTSLSGCRGMPGALTQSVNLTLAGCNPGASILTITGVSFSSTVTVTVGDQPCALQMVTATAIQCTLPTVTGVQAGFAYDLFVSDTLGNATVTGAIIYTTNPTIIAITSPFCPPDFAPPTNAPVALYCSAYSQLTLVGVYFQDLSTLQVNITASNLQPLVCDNLAYLTSTELTCTLPAASILFAQSGPHGLTVWENATFPSNTFRSYLYTAPNNQPNIASIQGCATVNTATRVVSGCAAGDRITVVGSDFVAFSGNAQVQLWADGEIFVCSAPRVLSSTQLTCSLPYLPALTVGSAVPIRIANLNGRQSNWLVAINYNVDSSEQSNSQSASSDARFIVTLSVLLPIIAILIALLVAAAIMIRHTSTHSKPQGSNEQQNNRWLRQSDFKEDSRVQMSDVHLDN